MGQNSEKSDNMDTKVAAAQAVAWQGMGIKGKDIAAALGITDGRASQLMKQVRETVAAETQNVVKSAPRELSIEEQLTNAANELELKVLKTVGEKIEMFSITAKPVELIKVAAILNGMKRRSGGLLGAGDVGGVGSIEINDNKIVRLEMPVSLRPQIVTDQQGEIVEANGRTLVTASRGQLLEGLHSPLPKIQKEENERQLTQSINETCGRFEVLPDRNA